MTTSTIENNETIQEAIRELEEQWKKENEERMNDYKEKLNVIEGYLNEQYSINKELKSLGESVLPHLDDQIKSLSKLISHNDTHYMETQKFLTYLRGTDKKTTSTVREKFGVVVKRVSTNVFGLDEEEKSNRITVFRKDISSWKEHYNEIKVKIDNLIDGDNYLGMLAGKLPIHTMNQDIFFDVVCVLENITSVDEEGESLVKKITKISNKVVIDMEKISKRMINLGFYDIYDELTEGNKRSGKPQVFYVKRKELLP